MRDTLIVHLEPTNNVFIFIKDEIPDEKVKKKKYQFVFDD